MFDLSGKVAIVTGGNGGVGLGMARGLAGAGAAIVIAARNAEKSRAAVRDLEARGASASAVETDVTDEKSVAAMVEAAIARCGRLDILVNNAGTNIRRPAHELGTADWHKVLDTNLTSAFLCSKAVHPALKRNGGAPATVPGRWSGAEWAETPMTRPVPAAASNRRPRCATRTRPTWRQICWSRMSSAS